MAKRYRVGNWCPRGGGHFELYADDHYDGSCGGKGLSVYLGVSEDDDPRDLADLPDGEWVEDDG